MQRTKDELRQLQSLPLETKIQMSQQRIKEWYDAHDGMVYVSFSGGKDSTVLKHLVENTPGIREREYCTERFLRHRIGVSGSSTICNITA